MIEQYYSLRPFSLDAALSAFEITGKILRSSHTLTILFQLQGPLEKLRICQPAAMPARLNGLWEKTCFECFIGTDQPARYWEFNLSPAGHWNVYRFESYRKGMAEESVYTSLPFHVRKQAGMLRVSLALALDKILSSGQRIRMGVSAVIQSQQGESSFWSLAHPGPAPDFHHREGFLLAL